MNALEIIDLSREIYDGMPVFSGMPAVEVAVHATHEEWEGLPGVETVSPAVNRLSFGEHTGTHVDALSHMRRADFGRTIETMPLSTFYTPGICLDLSAKNPGELIEIADLEAALAAAGQDIRPGETILIYTDHFRRTYGTPAWANGPGLSAAAARWLGEAGIAAFGVETEAPGVRKVSNRQVHEICGELGFTHYENLANLHELVGRGRFRFIGLPLKIRGGTGSPVRAVAVFEPEPVRRPVLSGRVVAPGGGPLPAEPADESRLDLFEVETPVRRFADLIVPEDTLQQLRALLTRIRYNQVLYEDFGLAAVDPYGGRTAINLYGPPGTGKSFAAEAIANELGMGIIRVNYAEVESKYVGETAKNIKAAFAKAREANAVLFFDEADSILGRRLTNVRQSTDHAVNISRSVMLLELDRFSGVTIFATNLASNYDSAFVRRILGHVEMPLPGPEARLALWRAHIPAQMPAELSESDWARLVEESTGLAGGDVLNCVINAASAALEREGPGCRIRLADFLQAVAAAKRAQAEIGG